MTSAPNDSSLSSGQDTNQFWYKWGLNSRFFIQPSETLRAIWNPRFDSIFKHSILLEFGHIILYIYICNTVECEKLLHPL